MRLQEEYFLRHNLNIPIVYHTKNSNLILKLHSRPQVILNIQWVEVRLHPGYYNLRYLSPIHNGYVNAKFFDELNSDYTCTYQDYFPYIKRWTKNLEFEPVPSLEADLAIFEIFLYCFDGWISKSPWIDLAFKVVDKTLDLQVRKEALHDFIHLIANKDWQIFRYYEEFTPYKTNYADWLVKLINSNKGAK